MKIYHYVCALFTLTSMIASLATAGDNTVVFEATPSKSTDPFGGVAYGQIPDWVKQVEAESEYALELAWGTTDAPLPVKTDARSGQPKSIVTEEFLTSVERIKLGVHGTSRGSVELPESMRFVYAITEPETDKLEISIYFTSGSADKKGPTVHTSIGIGIDTEWTALAGFSMLSTNASNDPSRKSQSESHFYLAARCVKLPAD